MNSYNSKACRFCAPLNFVFYYVKSDKNSGELTHATSSSSETPPNCTLSWRRLSGSLWRPFHASITQFKHHNPCFDNSTCAPAQTRVCSWRGRWGMLLHPRIRLPFSPSPREEHGTPSLTRLLISTSSEGEADAGINGRWGGKRGDRRPPGRRQDLKGKERRASDRLS